MLVAMAVMTALAVMVAALTMPVALGVTAVVKRGRPAKGQRPGWHAVPA